MVRVAVSVWLHEECAAGRAAAGIDVIAASTFGAAS